MPFGIREIDVKTGEQPGETSIEVIFGPHHRVVIKEDEAGEAIFSMESTHHGFEANADGDPETELWEMIESIRKEYPDHRID